MKARMLVPIAPTAPQTEIKAGLDTKQYARERRGSERASRPAAQHDQAKDHPCWYVGTPSTESHTIDLQDHDAPSAKDHSRPPPTLTLNGAVAPHQAETIREVAEDRAGEQCRSPRISWANADSVDLSQYAQDLAADIANSIHGGNMQQQQDTLAIAQNGGTASNASNEEEDVGVDGDEDLDDDDMMDKISSSPSIEDGGYTLPPIWPRRVDSLRGSISLRCDTPVSLRTSEAGSSSPYLDPPVHLPLQRSSRLASKAAVDTPSCSHHLPGEYTGLDDGYYEHNDFGAHDDNDYNDGYVEYLDDYDELSDCDLEASVQLIDRRDQPVATLDDQTTGHDKWHGDRDSGLQIALVDFPVADSPSVEPALENDDGYELMIPYDTTDDDDYDDNDFPFTDDPRFIDSGWGGECLQDAEDIDFEFVYALHTFVATVEGQANATKGDTMVLLDDSNSYWWLVRVVKDSSIATMLGDQAEKTKNPLKSAMRRRKAKTVTFTAPTYVDYSDIEYSTDEEEGENEDSVQRQTTQQAQKEQATAQQSAVDIDDESAKVEPLKPRSQQKQVRLDTDEKTDVDEETSADRSSDEMFEGKPERTSRNGTVRNTDSFFRDESIETKKITLTPGLLRDDGEPRDSTESKEARQRASMDRLEKDLVPDKVKDDKKKKDKKPGGIRSFFSRKDRKRSVDDDDESFGKRSMDIAGDLEESKAPEPESPEKTAASQRNAGKLQKQQLRTDSSPTRKSAPITTQLAQPNTVENVPPASSSLRMIESEPLESGDKSQKDKKSKSAALKTAQPNVEVKPQKVTRVKTRVELDEFDSSSQEEEAAPEPTRAPPEPQPQQPQQQQQEKPVRPTLPGSYPDSFLSNQTNATSKQQQQAEPEAESTKQSVQQPRSDSPASVSPVSPLTTSKPPALMADTSSQEDRSSPISSPSPELADADERTHRNQDSMTTSTSATTTSTWNDTNLRAFFDSGSEIRDLLTVVYDKTDVPPVGPEHPVVGLFREPNAKLAEITTQLDNMLGDWLARKQRLRGTV
ncbi:protein phosphatase regulator [Diatrype stigma]|uniref:Protein phosphatase regulator n=1 Tax=Diatrype stigma TaxID=117547 RepID=A0AAN9YRN3_9PEZI